jgi:hypothetical protein
LDQKHNNQGSRMVVKKQGTVPNKYKQTVKNWRSNGQEMEENEKNEYVAKRVAARASEDEEEEKTGDKILGRMGEDSEEEEEETDKEEEVLVMIEEEDTVSPLSSRQSTITGGRSKHDGWKTVGRKERRDAVTEATSKANTVGVKMVRIGKTGSTGYTPRNVSYFFTMLGRIDKTAVVLNARNETTSAKTVNEMEQMNAMDYKGFLDMRTDSWGGPTENKSKTVWMCYIASDLLQPNLQQLREDKQVQEYLRAGDITLQYTKLRESNSRIAFHIANKDPKYTNRNDLEERLIEHMKKWNDKDIPIHVLNMATAGKNFNTRMCTAVVGGRDVRKVESLFKEHPFEDLELIPISWKFQDIAGYTRRLKEHEAVLKLSRAIKLEEMNVQDELDDFKMLMGGDPAKEHVIDVFPANHAERTGVIYVQYINEHRPVVMQMVQDIVRKLKERRHEEEEPMIFFYNFQTDQRL